MEGIPKISSDKLVKNRIWCNQGINVLRKFQEFHKKRLFWTKSFLTLTQHQSEDSLKTRDITTTLFKFLGVHELRIIIAYIFSVNIHRNQSFFLIFKKELLDFVLERGGMSKQNLWV